MRNSATTLVVILAGITLILVAAGPAGTVPTATRTNQDCLDCHSDEDAAPLVDAGVFQGGPHTEVEAVSCVSCHPDALTGGHLDEGGSLGQATCGSCHSDIDKAMAIGVHREMDGEDYPACATCHGGHGIRYVTAEKATDETSRAYAVGLGDSCAACHDDAAGQVQQGAHSTRRFAENRPACAGCHGSHAILPAENPASRVNKLNQPATCGACHGGELLDNYMRSTHGQNLQAGRTDGPTCSTCHGGHRILPADIDRNQQFKASAVRACGFCHAEANREWSESVHGEAFLELDVYESATCADCHSSHQILPPGDPESTVYPTKIAKDCAACHADAKLIRRFGLPSQVVGTYETSYHGRASGLGGARVANCASCHENHAIFKMSNPRSSINPGNLAKTCGACHEGANENFIRGKIHVSDGEKDNFAVWFIGNAYIWLIVLTIGGMVAHNIFDFVRKMVLRNRQHKSEPHVVRMTLLERFLHATMAMSFILLAYTGFALVFPDAWWVAPLNLISNTEEFRSTLHRICGVVLTAVAFHHLWFLFFHPRGREQRREFMPRLKDVHDVRDNIAFYLGLRQQRPRFGRFTYMEKAEYWALVWGTAVMVVTGLVLWFQDIALQIMPLWLWEVFNVVHFYEAILAVLAIVVWHFYYIFINPDEAPMSLTWLTGRMTYKELAKVHPEEFEELMRAKAAEKNIQGGAGDRD